jgi:transcription initiation factor TFIID subunit 1
LGAQKGKWLLDQTGIADPTGCGQGFSYARVNQKALKDDAPQLPKRLVTGTNADLRKLPLKEAKEICRSYGVTEEEINALTRWEIIDVIRTLSTQAAKERSDFTGGFF